MNDNVLRKEGMNALIQILGHVDVERFIMLMNRDIFDYTKWRTEHLNQNISVRELSKKAMEHTNETEKN